MVGKSSDVFRSVGDAVSALLFRHPFYAHILLAMRRVVTEDIDTAAVSIRGGSVWLAVNPVFWLTTLHSDRHRQGVLLHEVLHVVLSHLTRLRDFPDLERFNIAADLAVNSLIPPDDLPSSALTVETPGLLAKRDRMREQTVDWYYPRLLEDAPQVAKVDVQLRGVGAEGWTTDMSDCTADLISGLVLQAAASVGQMELSRLPKVVRSAIQGMDMNRKPTVDWRRALCVYAGRSRRTRLQATQKRVSKRYGRVPGVRVCARSQVAVIVDTSGSIGDDQLQMFTEELTHIVRTKVEVILVSADDAVNSVEPYRGGVLNVSGRGGTDFDPAIQWANSNAHRIDGVVYFTDAEGPRTLPSRYRILWVVHSNRLIGKRPECAFPGDSVVWMGAK